MIKRSKVRVSFNQKGPSIGVEVSVLWKDQPSCQKRGLFLIENEENVREKCLY